MYTHPIPMPTYMHTHAYKHTHAHTHAYMAFFYETAFFPDIGRTTDLYKSTPWNFIISDLKETNSSYHIQHLLSKFVLSQ